MDKRSQWQSQTSVMEDKPLSADPALREDRSNDFPFFYANCCLGFFPVDPLDYQAFAKGQLIAMAIFVPAAMGLFIFCAS
ncbi:hypothetical protein [Bradyrhizobium sp. OAE829]|uniref:hypothetical protein n=1 Tax=Bradyrhizobium sp. OAE829 TaxID=2663807 RepID=UPI001789CAEF